MNAVMRLAQPHPIGAENGQWTSAVRVGVGNLVDDREVAARGRGRNFAQTDGIRTDEAIAVKEIEAEFIDRDAYAVCRDENHLPF